jgi:N-methylhydantoinase A
MSGPAGGVTGALWISEKVGYKNLLTMDVGGTSADVALIEGGVPKRRKETRVGDVTVRAQALDVHTVGAGGGSIAHVPTLTNALRVGPESAGAMPGPACYGKGGTAPTVTDANVVLGYLPSSLLGGEFKLDVEAAKKAVGGVAEKLGMSVCDAAKGIIDIVNEKMFGALRLVSVEQGYVYLRSSLRPSLPSSLHQARLQPSETLTPSFLPSLPPSLPPFFLQVRPA